MMTTDAIDPGAVDDPLERLRARIEMARAPADPPAPPEPGADDPLETLLSRLEAAADLDRQLDQFARRAADGPLAQLETTIARAAARTARGELEFDVHEAFESAVATDPLQQLHGAVAAEIGAVGSRAAVDLGPRKHSSTPDEPTSSRTPERSSTTTDLHARLGEEVLAIVGERDLPADARREAIRRLTAELDDPDPDALRDVLRLLLAPRDAES